MIKPLAYFVSRSTTASPDWRFTTNHMAQNGYKLARHIWDLKRSVTILYGRLTGTHTGANNSATLDDSGADFVASGVTIGDTVLNLTQNKKFIVSAVTTTSLTFQPVSSGDWDTTPDRYVILLSNLASTVTDSSTETDLWTVDHIEKRPEMDQTQAAAYQDALLAAYEKPVLQQAFILSAPYMKRGHGGRVRLWRPIFEGGGYFRFDDLEPNDTVLDSSDDREQVFLAVALDYTARNNRLRITPSTGDSRLDAILAKARLTSGETISTEDEGDSGGKDYHGGASGGHGDAGPDGMKRFPLPPWLIEFRRTGRIRGFKL